jgi:hypothetical protein
VYEAAVTVTRTTAQAVWESDMGMNTDKLLVTRGTGDGYDVPYAQIRETQLRALDEAFRERGTTIKLVRFRAEDADITGVESFEAVVPLLLPHTAYKSYPESFMREKKWDRLTRWLGTVSPDPITDIDFDRIEDVDGWVERLEAKGHFVSCTSGTTGNPAMLRSSETDMKSFCRDSIAAMVWGSGVEPAQDRVVFGLSPIAQVPRNIAISDALRDAFGVQGRDRFRYPVPPITIGSITRMISLRKSIADGSARPEEIAEYEATSAERQKAVDDAVGVTADALVAAREHKLYLSGMWATMYKVAEEIRNRGYDAKDFHPENTCFVAGGLKGAELPGDYREYVYDTFNLKPENNYQMYSMQELGTTMPRCQEGGRYHVPPWLVVLPLDKEGEALAPGFGDGTVEGRAAFFDLSLEGRWGGIITGDKIEIDYGPCACGHASPSIRDNIMRYSDLEGDDKISCSGTIDAYVRGVA